MQILIKFVSVVGCVCHWIRRTSNDHLFLLISSYLHAELSLALCCCSNRTMSKLRISTAISRQVSLSPFKLLTWRKKEREARLEKGETCAWLTFCSQVLTESASWLKSFNCLKLCVCRLVGASSMLTCSRSPLPARECFSPARVGCTRRQKRALIDCAHSSLVESEWEWKRVGKKC